jgi:hypothetical protein
MLAAALRSHRQLYVSGIAACALLFVAAANISPTRAAEHTLMPSPQTVHIGYFLASIKPVLSIESGDIVTLESVAAIVPSLVDQAGAWPVCAGCEMNSGGHLEFRRYAYACGLTSACGDRHIQQELTETAHAWEHSYLGRLEACRPR